MNTFRMIYSLLLSPLGKFNRCNFQIMALVLLVFSCTDLPTDPKNVSNSSVDLSLKTSSRFTVGKEVYDTVGNNVEFIVALQYPQFISSTKIQIMASNGLVDFDTSLISVSKSNTDTIRFTKGIVKAGDKMVVATAHRNDGSIKTDTAYMHITDRVITNDNVAPQWDISDTLRVDLNVGTTYSLNLQDTCSDTNGDVLQFTLLTGDPATDTIVNNVYSFISSKSDTGKVVARIVAKDQGNLSDTLIIKFTLKPEVLGDTTHPVVSVKNIVNDSLTVSSSSTTIELNCTDISGIKKVEGFIGTTSCLVTKVNDSTYNIAVKDLVANQPVKVTIVATDNSASSIVTTKEIYLKYDPTMTDTAGPVITLQTPEDSSSVSSSTVAVVVKCTDSSGIKSVTCTVGGKSFDGTKGTSDSYTANITGLVKGLNLVVFTVTDASTNANKTADTFKIVYDTTITDNVAPIINLKNPVTNGERVFNDTVTIQIACKDDNGIASVTCKRAGQAVTVINSADSLYSAKITGLTAGKADTITFIATDKSANANSQTLAVVVKYNTMVGIVTAISPLNNATGVAIQPTFTWTGGDDPDGDEVTYTVKYGTSSTSLTKSITGITSKSTTLTSSLTANTVYYWLVVANSKANSDVTESDVLMFTTVEAAPVITKDPSDTSVLVGNKTTFSVSATGIGLKYKWQKDTTDISGVTTSTYTTAVTVSSDNGTTYRCIVSNDGGSDTSVEATLTIQYSVIYDGNGNTSGSVPVDANSYSKNETVTTKAITDLARNGYEFTGWNTKSDGTGTTYPAGTGTFTMQSANVTLYAQWAVIYTVIFNDQGATKPVSPTTISVTESKPIGTLPTAPEKTSYVFAGWWTAQDGGGTEVTASTIVTSGMTVYAKWEIRDVDGNVYHEVKIGDQIWMLENLRTTKYRNGTAVDTGGIKFPNGVESNKTKYGILYGSADNNLAPLGWRIPTKEDFEVLINYLKSNGYGYKGVDTAIAKSLASIGDWQFSDTVGTPGSIPLENNKSGFSAFPSGNFSSMDDSFGGFGSFCSFLTTSLYIYNGPSLGIIYSISNRSDVLMYETLGNRGNPLLSIRLIKE
jgi:uncharacterized protein (TIGR02145 family)/uncharacterized repeat protein (TIGR02543 family)